jgi:hypothetical protein
MTDILCLHIQTWGLRVVKQSGIDELILEVHRDLADASLTDRFLFFSFRFWTWK